MNVATKTAGTPLTKPTVLLYKLDGPSRVPLTPAEVAKDRSAKAADTAGRAVVDWFAKTLHPAGAPGTPSRPLQLVLEPGSNNAYWNGTQMNLGLGTEFKPLVSDDIIAHEYAHSLDPKDRSFAGEAGAITESVADVVAEVFDGGDWVVGAGAIKGGFRDLAKPRVANVKQLTGTTEVHELSGIPSLAAVRAAKVLDPTVVAQLWFGVSQSLGATPTFRSFADAIVGAGVNHYGAETVEAQALRDAWVSVGVL